MLGVDRERIIGDEYFDLIVEYRSNPQIIEMFENVTVHIMNEFYAVLHIPIEEFFEKLPRTRYAEIPHLFGLTDEVSLDASRVFNLRSSATFNLSGEGVIIAIKTKMIDRKSVV